MLDDELVSIFTTIAATLFASELELCPAPPRVLRGSVLTGRVSFYGDFEGVLMGSFPEGVALALTDAMMHRHLEPSSYADVCDAVGEVVNIAAGNVKGLLSGDVRISLPSVRTSAEVREEPAGNERVGRAWLSLFGEPVLVQLLSPRHSDSFVKPRRHAGHS